MNELQERIHKQFSGPEMMGSSCFAIRCEGVDGDVMGETAARLVSWCEEPDVRHGCICGAASLRADWLDAARAVAAVHKKMVQLQLVSHAHFGEIHWRDIDIEPDGRVQEYNMTAAADHACTEYVTYYDENGSTSGPGANPTDVDTTESQ